VVIINRAVMAVVDFGKVVLLGQFEEELDVFIQLFLILLD
jgi:hypothetical protein